MGPLLLSVAYYLGAQAAFLLGTLSDRIFAPFWPPNVILFCALLFVPYKRWWLYGVAAVPAHVLAELQVGMPILQMAVAFATNCLVAVLSAYAVRRLLGAPPWFDNFRRAVVYVVVTAVVSPAVVALGGAFVRISEGAALELYGLFWAQWYLANALASLTLGPAILTWFERDANAPSSTSFWRQGEGLLVAACLALACFLVGHAAPLAEERGLLPALLYLPLPIVLWATVRFGAKGASGAVLIVTVLTIWPALNGAGMFVGADPEKNVLDLQLFLATISVPVLLLGASMDGARRTERVMRELARSLSAIRDDERRTIGRDLHESIAQMLVAASWKATEAQRAAPEARGSLKDLDDLLQESIRKVRTVSYLLHPPCSTKRAWRRRSVTTPTNTHGNTRCASISTSRPNWGGCPLIWKSPSFVSWSKHWISFAGKRTAMGRASRLFRFRHRVTETCFLRSKVLPHTQRLHPMACLHSSTKSLPLVVSRPMTSRACASERAVSVVKSILIPRELSFASLSPALDRRRSSGPVELVSQTRALLLREMVHPALLLRAAL